MDFADRVRQFSKQASGLLDKLRSEEATKVSLIMPFLQLLGYNVFDPTEVIPEFDADVSGVKKGEKVDYAILINGKPAILIEAKPYGDPLVAHDTQLYRYFSVTEAKFAILTNGVIYKFYSDLQEPNKLDPQPFFEFNILEPKDALIQELKRFHKENFNLEDLSSAATELKYTTLIKKRLELQMREPGDEFVRYWLRDLYPGKLTQNVVEHFRPVVKKALTQYVNDLINDRLASAMKTVESDPREAVAATSEPLTQSDEEDGIITLEEELEAYYVVKSMLRKVVEPARITYRDRVTYFNVLLDDNIRKWICRIFVRDSGNAIVFNGDDQRYEYQRADDLFTFESKFLEVLRRLEPTPEKPGTP